jgi:glycosyltransferase involved in cell wall biosynthesis
MSQQPELFIGITTFNSGLFIGHCLDSLAKTTRGNRPRIVLCDKFSTDGTAETARKAGAEVVRSAASQADAYNILFSMSRSPYTLIIHADTVLLSDQWFELCKSRIKDNVALVSPQDIGCGPYTRPFGAGMPESSFLFFDTEKMLKARIIRWLRRFGIPLPERCLDFYAPHITHRLPDHLKRAGLSWFPMEVHTSNKVAAPIYAPDFKPKVWSDELPYLQYGLGNFYSIDGVITHYHNWYERRIENTAISDPRAATEKDGKGFPLAYIKTYTETFLRDYTAGCVSLPPAVPNTRKPKAL